MKTRSYRYEARGIQAIDPSAFLDLFFVEASTPENVEIGDITVVDIRGPLDQRSSWRDSYEAIEQRFAVACESACKAIVMRVDSPGGEAAGCFESSRKIRAMCEAAGKPLYGYVSGKAGSAAYALLTAAQQIVLSDTGIVGSIGIIACREDISAMDAARGLRVAYVASGARKADGNVHQPISEAELGEMQKLVDSMAQVFFDLVAEMRGIDAAAVAALNGKVFHGDAAISAGLADEIGTFDELLAAIVAGDGDAMTVLKAKAGGSPYQTARAALEEAAKGDDANAAAAKRALAAMDSEDKPKGDDDKPEPKGDDDKPEPKDDDKPEPKGDDDKPEPKDDDKPKEGATANEIALQALTEVHKLRAERATEKEATERETLLASRPDFAPEMLAILRDPTTPIATVRKTVKDLPKGKAIKPAAITTVPATRGEGQGEVTPSTGDAGAEMDAAMGLVEYGLGVTRTRNSMVFGVVPKPKAKPAAAGANDGGAK